MSAERLRQYANEVEGHPMMQMTYYEAGYVAGLRKAAELMEKWEKEER